MARPKKPIPDMYWLESASVWCVTICGKRIRLGRDESEAKLAYQRLIGEMLLTGRPPQKDAVLSIDELIVAYLRHAIPYYSTNGQPNGMTGRIETAVRVLRRLYGPTPASDFGPLALRACLDECVRLGYLRNTCNALLQVLKRLFRWAVSVELLPEETYRRVATVQGLRKGHTAAPEAAPIRAAPEGDVEKAVLGAGRVLGAMIRLQELTGMRPCEVCALKPCHVDRTGDVWVYLVPAAANKTENKGIARPVAIGPKGQAVLEPFLERPADAYCFSPREAEADGRRERHARRKERKTLPRTPHHPKDRTGLGERYSTHSYRQAIARLCKRAGVPVFRPNQLRHLRGTKIRALFGREAAQGALGHADPRTTDRYAAVDLSQAKAAAKEAG
jgi:integrase